MNTLNYQEIAEILESVLPDRWIRVVFRAEYRPGGFTMKYYVKLDKDSDYVDCYRITDISPKDITLSYLKIDEELYKSRRDIPEEKRWTVFTFVLDSDGRFKAEVAYEDIIDDYDTFIDAWKGKYLMGESTIKTTNCSLTDEDGLNQTR